MKIKIITIILLIGYFNVFGQRENRTDNTEGLSFKERLFTGGNFGLQFGTITNIEISPILGYRVTENFVFGIGATYICYSNSIYTPKYSTDIYGGRLFSRYYFFEKIFAHAELETLNYEAVSIFHSNNYTLNRVWSNGVLLGGGYRQMLGEFSSIHLTILWNFNEDIYSPYTNPIIRVGFDIGL